NVRQHKHVQTSEQERQQREQWRVDNPGGRFPQSHRDKVCDDGRGKGDRQPAVNLPNPHVLVQWGASFKTSGSATRQTSICRQDLLKLRVEMLPPALAPPKACF